ncbi:MBL fold metallo-hydrolase [bacterium]|nr:MBL fold metallo-hydrolase [bacterium]
MHRIFIDGGDPAVTVVQIGTPDLGDHSYAAIVGSRAVVIDPQRDIERMSAALGGVRLLAVFETHIHNDYVTGGHLLARHHGAEYVLPEGSGALLPHTEIANGQEWPISDGWAIRAVHTPGHTFQHMSYELVGPDGAAAVFSGGSMLVGAVGRSDLLGPEHTDTLAREQFRSVRHLADTLPGSAFVVPTHGAGSFCSASTVADLTSTIGLERGRNPALTEDDIDTFVRTQVAAYRLHPAYYTHMGPANLTGVEPIDLAPLLEIDPDELAGIDAEVVDLRSSAEWGASHIPGSLCIPARDDTAQYIGWVLPWNRDIVLVGSAEQVGQVRLQLARIGYDAVVGAVTDGLAAWRSGGRPLAAVRATDFAAVADASPGVLVDARDPVEYADGHLPGAIGMHVSRLAKEDPPGDPGDEVWLYCASGYRASVAAGFVARSGRIPVIVIDDWDDRGRPLADRMHVG